MIRREVNRMSERDDQAVVLIEEVRDFGLVTLKANFLDTKICDLVTATTGICFPKIGRISLGKKLSVGWMSIDEIAIILADSEADKITLKMKTKLKSYNNLCVNVSDSRCCFRLCGHGWREVLSKGTPVNLNPTSFTIGSFRRTRLGNVAVAIWAADVDEAYLFSMRSVGSFVSDWLCMANLKSGQLKYY